MKRKPIVGERLYTLNIGNNARHRAQVLTPVTVAKVGRKYFTVIRVGEWQLATEFYIEDWRERTGGYSANHALYETEQEWADEKEATALCRTIGNAFEYGRNVNRVSLETLRMIAAKITTP